MLKTNVYNMSGKLVGEIELPEAVFGIDPNGAVVHEVVKNHLANLRQGTQSALTRAEVSGGGRKPWKQKGTGRARQGSTPVDPRRYRVRPQAPGLQLHPEQEGQAAGSEERPVRQGC